MIFVDKAHHNVNFNITDILKYSIVGFFFRSDAIVDDSSE